MNYKFCFIFFAIIFLLQLHANAQSISNLSNIRVEELTDEQIKKLVIETDRSGIKDEQLEELATQSGLNQVEIVKLKERMQLARKAMNASATPSVLTIRSQDSISAIAQKPVQDFRNVLNGLQANNFGFEIFANPRITFEPNLRLPTPKNYQLAADDELIIDVSGYSEANYHLKVSPEGIIRIPVAGPVNVNGLTIEQATNLIVKKLSSTIYGNIKTGNTSVDVSLGATRSMKVTIIGEATVPGTYTLPSLASAFNALYACGGPNQNGSLRNIQIIRNNNIIATIDVYQYLLNGNKKNDIRLMDQDVIKISTYNKRIELKGEVKKPGLYDVIGNETLRQILKYADDFTDNAYTERITVFRNTSKERMVTTISQAQIDHLIPQKGDSYIVGKIINKFSNRISIRGAVYRPGEYELKDSMSLLQLINEADGLREDVFISRGIIHRLKKDLSPEIIAFDIQELLNDPSKDIILKKEDQVNIYSKFDLREGYYVRIDGEVSNPGIFLYEEGMTAQDLVMMAGGFTESASKKRVEISRRVKDTAQSISNSKMALIYQQDINADLRDTTSAIASFSLSPFDEIAIHPAPGYFIQKNVVAEGEVAYTGKYTLETKSDRISDLVKRAGGLTPEAYIEGAVLVRAKHFTKTEQANNDAGINSLLKQNYVNGSTPELLQNELKNVTMKKSEAIGIDLKKIMANPHSEYDLFLNDGDSLRIPKQLQTVRVSGEVLYPTLERYSGKNKLKDYITGAGGFSDKASKRKVYVVYANGSVKGTKSFLFFRNYPSVKPGCDIYIPMRRERERVRTIEIVSIVATLAALLNIGYNIIRK